MEASKHVPSVLVCMAICMALVQTSRAQTSTPKERFMAGHTRLRTMAKAPPLEWDDKMGEEAATFTAKYKKECCQAPPNPTAYGENFYCFNGDNPGVANAFGFWDWEQYGYDVVTKACSGVEECTGYLQAVSPDSKKFGCAQVDCDAGGELAVCYYDPPAKGAPFPRPPLHRY